MSFLYPRVPRRELPALIGITLAGAVCAGLYGAVHDQVSYTIGPEYFTRMKFRQFAWADLGAPPRLFAAEIGALASWWAGLIAGWILARLGLATTWAAGYRGRVVRAFGMVIGVTLLSGIAATLIGFVVCREGVPARWEGLRERFGVSDLRGFVTVAFLHWGSYLGAVLGTLLAALDWRRWRCRIIAAAEH